MKEKAAVAQDERLLAVVLYGLWGAIRCLGGHDFKYAIIGNWLERGL